MLSSLYRYVRYVAAALFAAGFIFTAPVSAQTPTVAQFLANPAQVLQQFPNGGPQLIALVRDVAVSNPQALQTLVSLMNGANAAQQTAFGTGLGQAAQIVVGNNPAYAAQIQQAVAGSTAEAAKVAFAGVTGNVQIAATGPGGGGGGSGGPTGSTGFAFGGSNTGGGGGTGGGQGFQTNAQTFTGGGAGGPGGASSSTSPR